MEANVNEVVPALFEQLIHGIDSFLAEDRSDDLDLLWIASNVSQWSESITFTLTRTVPRLIDGL